MLTLCLAGLADMLALGVKFCLRAVLNKPEERLQACMIPSADLSGGESLAAAALFSSTLLDSGPVTLLSTCQVLFITRVCRSALGAAASRPPAGSALQRCSTPALLKLLMCDGTDSTLQRNPGTC